MNEKQIPQIVAKVAVENNDSSNQLWNCELKTPDGSVIDAIGQWLAGEGEALGTSLSRLIAEMEKET